MTRTTALVSAGPSPLRMTACMLTVSPRAIGSFGMDSGSTSCEWSPTAPAGTTKNHCPGSAQSGMRDEPPTLAKPPWPAAINNTLPPLERAVREAGSSEGGAAARDHLAILAHVGEAIRLEAATPNLFTLSLGRE